MPRASIVVAAHDAEGSLPTLLRALEAQTLPADEFELVVVDDGSSDATSQLAEAAGAKVVKRTERGGAYAARNSGLAVAAGDVLVITDADCEPSPRWLEEGLRELEREEVDLLGGRVDIDLGAQPSLPALVDFARCLDQRNSVEELGYAVTANLFVRRRVVDAIGAFNDRLISGGDGEFCMRATAAGFRLGYSDSAVVRHEPRRTARQLARKGFRLGFGFGQHRYFAEGRLRERPRLWSRPGAWRPRGQVPRVERLTVAGHASSRMQRGALLLGQYLMFDLPMVVGNLAASVRRGRFR